MAFLCKQLRTSYSRRNATRSVINCFLVHRERTHRGSDDIIFLSVIANTTRETRPHMTSIPRRFFSLLDLSRRMQIFVDYSTDFFVPFLLAKFVVHKLQSDHAQLLRISFGTAALLIEIKYMIIFNHILPHQNVRVRAFQTEFNATNFFGFSSFSLNRVCGCGCKCFSTQFVCKSSDHSVPFSSVMV